MSPKTHPLVQRLVADGRAAAVTPDTLADWAGRAGDHVLLLAGDPVQFPEGTDVAIVLPELQAAFAGRFDLGVVPREEEDAVARRYGVNRWPSLVFVRGGGYVTTLPGMRDWGDYVDAVREALAAPVGRAPSVGIPVVSASAGSSCH